MDDKARQEGFTLIELMIAVAIIGILIAVGFPSYLKHAARANRNAAESFMLQVASRQEQSMMNSRQYFSATTTANYSAVNLAIPTEVSGYYTVTVTADNTATPPAWTVTAVPTSTQTKNDISCGTLTYNQAGTKAASGSAGVSNCWR